MTGTCSFGHTRIHLGNQLVLLVHLELLTAIRFENVNVPPGATITAASIQFESDSADTAGPGVTPLVLYIYGERSVTPPTFNDTLRSLSTRPPTMASATWHSGRWTAKKQEGANQTTVDLSPIVQELIGLPGWVSGGSMVLLMRRAAPVDVVPAPNHIATKFATLRVEFTRMYLSVVWCVWILTAL